jgi:hypothetical protein
MSRRVPHLVFAWLVSCAVVLPVASGAQAPPSTRPPDTSAKAVVAKAVAYLKEYQEALRFVLSDEVTVQEVFNRTGNRVARRETSGDYFLTYLPADGGWIGVRDIAIVDGMPVENRDNLRELLTRGSFARIGRQLADGNARYNIGSIGRNFNDPMLALAILDDKHRDRFKFDRRRAEATPSGPLVTVSFTERDRPTLVRGSDGGAAFAKGELVIDATTGHIHRTFITLKVDGTQASLTTVFTRNDKLALWLPASLSEQYKRVSGALRETVSVESTYTNYRRFDVKVVIK